eukprot:782736-Rhodomonas_salina.2
MLLQSISQSAFASRGLDLGAQNGPGGGCLALSSPRPACSRPQVNAPPRSRRQWTKQRHESAGSAAGSENRPQGRACSWREARAEEEEEKEGRDRQARAPCDWYSANDTAAPG